jgi:hypothetical protein
MQKYKNELKHSRYNLRFTAATALLAAALQWKLGIEASDERKINETQYLSCGRRRSNRRISAYL